MKSEILKQIGANLRQARLEREFTQERLAELSGLHSNYVGGIERGERNVAALNLVALCRALGCDISDLFLGVVVRKG
jgi:transcriptional regulator with XRE-family HTH domain